MKKMPKHYPWWYDDDDEADGKPTRKKTNGAGVKLFLLVLIGLFIYMMATWPGGG
jgi:hypothetical protein